MLDDALPRVIADERNALRALTLTEVPRLHLLDRTFERRKERARAAETRQALVILGEGGMGKSVLLGQVLQMMEAQPTGAIVLVSAILVDLKEAYPTRDDIDRAMGLAVGDAGRQYGLLDLINNLKSQHGSVTLLIDTLDLLTAPETIGPLSAIIVKALDIGNVVITCRAEEFRDFFEDVRQSSPRLVNRMTKYTMPKLTPEEIVDWADHYLARSEQQKTGEEISFLQALQNSILRRSSLQEVCAVPVRLTLTCQVFAEMGYLPEDLTVTGLYNAYWDARVARHSGLRSTTGDAKEAAALEIASHVLGTSDRLYLRIPKGRLSNEGLLARRQLSSEGVLIERSTSWQFFHQSFAEYACARWLLTLGADGDEIGHLGAELSAGRTNLWSLASSVLLQADDDSYAVLCQRLPLAGPQGAKVHATAAMRQPDPQAALENVVRQIEDQPELWVAVTDALADAPRGVAAYDVILRGLQEYPARLASAASSALALIIARSRPDEVEPVLAASLRVLVTIRPQIDGASHDRYTAKLIQALVDFPQTPGTLSLALSFYPQVGSITRQAIIRMHLAYPVIDAQATALAAASLSAPCPPLRDEEAIQVLRLFWEDQATRSEHNWNIWRELLGDTSLTRGWHNAKVRLVAALADADEEIREGLIADILEARVSDTDSYVHALEHLASQDPGWVANRLLSGPAPTSTLAISAVANVVPALVAGISTETATALLNWLYPCRTLAPRNVWPALINLAGTSLPTHQRVFDDLIAANEAENVMESALDTWFFWAPLHVLTELAQQMRSLLRTGDADVMQARARLEGRLFGRDASADAWVTDAVLAGQSPRIARTAIKTIADVAATGTSLAAAVAAQLVTLLPTRHTDATRRILLMLTDAKIVDNEAFKSLVAGLTPQAVARFKAAIQRKEDPQLTEAILDTLIRCDTTVPLDRLLVRELYDALAGVVTAENRSEGDAVRVSAVLHQIFSLCGTLMAWRLPHDETRNLLHDLLTQVRLEDLGAKTVRAAARMLVGIGYRDPEGLDWMEDLFGAQGASPGLKQAIAEACLVTDHRHAGGRASRLKDRPDCPPAIVTYIIKRLMD